MNQAMIWATVTSETVTQLPAELYCQTRDVFQARLDTMTNQALRNEVAPEDTIYLISAMAGEIGNNSFDHNLGSWPDVPGIFFGYDFLANQKQIILADRGQGVLTTLKKVRPTLSTHAEALEVAFKEKISGRAPENRGNGLKFVRQAIHDQSLHLTFFSGNAGAELNEVMSIKKTENKIQGCLAILSF